MPGPQIALRRVAVDDHSGALAESGEEHLHLHGGGVLGLVENHGGLGQGAPAHEGEWSDLDHSCLEAALDHPAVHEVIERIVDRAQIGIDLFAHVAGQEPQPLARFDRRTRQDEPLDKSLLEQRHRMADREPGLAGAGRAFGEYQFVFAHGGEIAVLCGASGAHDPALAGIDDPEGLLRFLFARKQKALIRAFRDRALHVALARRLTQLDPLVKHLKNPARLLARFPRALDDNLIAVGVGRDAEAALDARDILIIMAEHHRSGGVVGECDRDFGRFGFVKRRIRCGGGGGDARSAMNSAASNRLSPCLRSGVRIIRTSIKSCSSRRR